ncbi:23S rRNA (uracil(747)-C(5))-methyltransferase RlmC [Krasilnikoviella flava]|uniref:23S rRNA (Uracil747-C5)-methyltransferase n=1 Tax=Krasilnikoviella flava TaxID=526729 RepID=A0A1T5K3L1_9MICO|nr:23S rRNA (uracil(747)-C(5))-methyltransferase RlmC [Krasilnikoviella flava]SKC58115.1 23S rRNA (uracil747-C5)-methyltransferase [Krasilnikoviella flava]
MQCPHFDAGRCHSCTLLATPYPTQVREKQEHVAALLADDRIAWLPPATGPEAGFRNKAKMVVSGTLEEPVLGILGSAAGPFSGQGIDLTDCGLYPGALQESFPVLAELITRARLQPYDATSPSRGARRRETPRESAWRGELKHVLVTLSADGELMVRFVLRSQEPVARLRKHLSWLLAALPQVAVVSVNVQPAHAAVLEGEQEIVLTDRHALPMRVGADGITLHLRPQSFFQTNTAVASALYAQARAWVDEVGPASLFDLYCGVGGFALHCAAPGRTVTGIEISAEAIASATTTRDELAALPAGAVVAGHDATWWAGAVRDVRFAAGDATAVARDDGAPELVIVNPPRRGIGADLSRWLEDSDATHVLYSSCNAVTLAEDLARMPSLRPTRARLLDMFPQTSHYEVLVLLERTATAG